ncbi:vitamin-D-receptor interacting mediator subunit 4-domain-containing protein [Fusarium tricinctum]|uniref:Mediator of RNA polymerase II transcription subunit 4 n=1 Tax=Fusarium tricinctum TaxID=61284 RepID=A0A8K0W8S8_9HYPO|nr:vitamin-D-receptor interacting mediator subunit 4-domain-containing protein [Fusarium tricinctum]
MDTYIDGRFERLEKALANLIDSVSKYHPSTIQGDELNAADKELSKGLEEVQTHQNNYLRIQQLRESSAALDAQIRETISNLATTRKDIVTTPTTTFPAGPSYAIAYEELLKYARRISKTTMPPAGTIKAVPPTPDGPDGQTPGVQTPGPDSQTASVMTPSAPPSSQVQSPAVMNGGTPQVSQEPATQQSALSANTNLPNEWTQFLNPLTDQIFLPWPNDLQIGAGALASNQVLLEQGINPKGYDPAEEEERKRREEEERKQKEEEDRIAQEEREKKIREERERQRIERERQREKDQEAWRRASLVGGPSAAPGEQRSPTGPPPQKAQFQFTNLDDLDDDDDDD